MAERTIRVCDVDGVVATHTVRIRDGRANWLKDLCDKDFAALIQGARKPRPGRQPGAKVAGRRPVAKNGRRRKVVSRRKAPAAA